MRRLGAELGVEAMSLYKHVAGKDAMLDGVRELLLRRAGRRAPARPTTGLARAASAASPAATARSAAPTRRPSGCSPAAPTAPTSRGAASAEAGPASACWPPASTRTTAAFALRTVVRYVLGFSLIDMAGEDAPAPLPAPSWRPSPRSSRWWPG